MSELPARTPTMQFIHCHQLYAVFLTSPRLWVRRYHCRICQPCITNKKRDVILTELHTLKQVRLDFNRVSTRTLISRQNHRLRNRVTSLQTSMEKIPRPTFFEIFFRFFLRSSKLLYIYEIKGGMPPENDYLASFPIFLFRSVRMVSRIAGMCESRIGCTRYGIQPEALMQSSIPRSSRIDSARGNRIVRPRWYWSVQKREEKSTPGKGGSTLDSPVLVISAAFTLSINELQERC